MTEQTKEIKTITDAIGSVIEKYPEYKEEIENTYKLIVRAYDLNPQGCRSYASEIVGNLTSMINQMETDKNRARDLILALKNLSVMIVDNPEDMSEIRTLLIWG